MIIGTAGHIDHGKTSLVKALTGVDTDRLPEEQRRGITIELGFAPLVLPDIGTVGVVDVPGHEDFIRTMVAGATGIDLGLLVVAADEGVMPQTREHLAILRLLGVETGVVALTKSDLVDADWLELVAEDLRLTLQHSSLQAAPIVPTSIKSGAGLDQLRRTLADQLMRVRPRRGEDVVRLPIDRVFSAKGTGTVVTGTSWSGELSLDASLLLFPAAKEVRVRGLQQHGASVSKAPPGARVAVALAGVDVDEVPRGSMLLGKAAWSPSTRLHAEVWLESGATVFRPREWLRLHVGTAEVGARVVVTGDASTDAGTLARIVTDTPLIARAGDRFVLRRSQPLATIGGGVITDPAPTLRRSRPEAGLNTPLRQRLEIMVASAGASGLDEGAIPIRLGTDLVQSRQLLEDSQSVVRSAGRLFLRSQIDEVSQGVVMEVDKYVHLNSLEIGQPLASLRSTFEGREALFELGLKALVEQGRIELASGLVRQPGWVPAVSDHQARILSRAEAVLDAAGREPPSLAELSNELGESSATVASILRYAERIGSVVQVEPDRWFRRQVLDSMISLVVEVAGAQAGLPVSPAAFRERLGISRKFLVPFLEFCDKRRITERRGEGRVLA